MSKKFNIKLTNAPLLTASIKYFSRPVGIKIWFPVIFEKPEINNIGIRTCIVNVASRYLLPPKSNILSLASIRKKTVNGIDMKKITEMDSRKTSLNFEISFWLI